MNSLSVKSKSEPKQSNSRLLDFLKKTIIPLNLLNFNNYKFKVYL